MLRRFIREIWSVAQVVPHRTTLTYLSCITSSIFEVAHSRKLWPADLKMARPLSLTYCGTNLVIDCPRIDAITREPCCSTFSAIREMYARDVYLKAFSRLSWKNAIDAGGNRGLFTAFLAQHCEQVVYIEPQHHFRAALDQILKDNYSPCIVHVENKFLRGHHNERGITISEIFEKYKLQSVSFLKCDIEGSEFDVFAGDATWLKRVDNIAMEVHRDTGDPNAIVCALAKSGFETLTLSAALRSVPSHNADYVFASRTSNLRSDL